MRARHLAVVTLLGLGLVAACSGPGETAQEASDPDGGEAATPDPTTPEPTAGDEASMGTTTVTERPTTLPDSPVGRFADGLVTSSGTEAAVGGSPASYYLAYLAKMTELTGIPVGRIGRIDGQGFVLEQGQGRADVRFDGFVTTGLGVVDAELDGRSLADIVGVLARPVIDPSGVVVSDGYGFTSYGADRVVLLTIRNGSDLSFTVDPAAASFLRDGGVTLGATSIGLEQPVELTPGSTSEVLFAFGRGDGAPDGLLELVLAASDPAVATELMLTVPIGVARPTFFDLGPGGTLEGVLDADIAFATGSAEPSIEALDILFKASREIGSYDRVSALCVAGHADSVGDETTNLELSVARAEAVVTVLVDSGVTNPIVAAGYGEAFAPGEEQDDPASRRVDVTFADCPDRP